MRFISMLATATCMLATPVFAQGEGGSGLKMSSEQQRAIYEVLAKQPIKASSSDFDAAVGQKVPRSTALYPVPRTTDTASVRRYRYTMANSRAVLVEPKTRKIVIILGVGF
jgi:hypothetical protein